MSDLPSNLHPETLAIRAGRQDSQFKEHSQALFLSSSFCFDSAQDGAELFLGQQEGYTYSRFTNPTVAAFEQRLAAMEGGERAMATASGMAAIHGLMLTFLQSGDHIVSSRSLFGSTLNLFNVLLPRLGITTTFVDGTDLEAWKNAAQPNTKMFFLETPSNPQTELSDIAKVAQIAHDAGAYLAVDNCFCTPAIQKPLSLGADFVVHSATKGLDGHGRVLGGAVVGSDALIESVYLYVRGTGPSLSAFNAWVLLSGLETLHIRMERQSENALKVAQFLEANPNVERVFYPGLASHPQYELACQQQSRGGCVVTFVVKNERAGAWTMVDSTQLFSKTANLGDVKSTITHPASTTHARVSPEARAAAGIVEGMVRLSIGLEHADDMIADLKLGLDRLS